MSDFLEQMGAASRERVRTARAACPQAELLAQAEATPRPPRLCLQPGGFDLIAELKLRSPAVGRLKG
ncbi:MAG: indole-3-glycerol phosphate synthase TrpC, partial [Steroidobacteraceae bacterium]